MATPIEIINDGPVTPRDLAVATWVTRKSLIASVGETVTVLSLYLDPINTNEKVLDFAPFLCSYVREFELSHSNLVN